MRFLFRAPLPGDLPPIAISANPSLRQRVALMVARWRQRVTLRRRFSQMDARSLMAYGISPAAAAYESGKPFWSRMGSLD